MRIKKMTFYFVAAFLFLAIAVSSQQQPAKKYKVELSAQEWQMILQIIDDSPTPGEVRKPLINTIQSQVNSQIRPDTAIKPITDTTKKKGK